MEMYLIKSTICLGIFFAFYKVFLERENMHTFKRFFLLGGVLASYAIPLYTFTKYVVVTAQPVETVVFSNQVNITTQTEAAVNYFPIFFTIYMIGLLFFSLKFAKNLYRLVQKIKKNPLYKNESIFHVLINDPITPHTFLNYIFLNKKQFENREIPNAVILHEAVHAREKHSLDILFIQLIQVIFWFNPIVYLIKNSIKLNHEFLADRAVLKKGIDARSYQHILLAFSSDANTPSLANSINYSSIKKRFTVMKSKTSKRGILLRSFILLPLLALLIYGFSNKETVTIKEAAKITQVTTEKASPEQLAKYNSMAGYWNNYFAETNKRVMPLDQLKELEVLYRIMDADQKADAAPFPHCEPAKTPKATPKQIAEYNKLAKKYNTMEKDNMRILGKELTRINYIYGLMTPEQKKNAEPYPDIPPPPPAPKAPNAVDAPQVKLGINDQDKNIPPPPPPPPTPDPLDHIIEMAKKGATFYFEGKKISSDTAIALIKENADLNIESSGVDSSNPQVKITTAPVRIKKENEMVLSIVDMPFNGPTLDLSDPSEILKYMVEHGATIYLDGELISEAKALELIKSQKSIKVNRVETPHDIPAVIFGPYGC